MILRQGRWGSKIPDIICGWSLEQPWLVGAAHRQRDGEAEVAHQGALLDGDVLQHEHDHAREEGAVREAVEEPNCLLGANNTDEFEFRAQIEAMFRETR